MGVRRSYTRIFTAQTDGLTDARMDGWTDWRMDGWKGCRQQTTARCWKATTVFIQFSLNVANALKTFRLRARQKSKKKILETFNVVAAAAAASGFVFPSCLLSLSLHTLLALSFGLLFMLLLLGLFFFFFFSFLFFLPTRDVQKLNGNQHITSGKICVNKVAGVVAHRRHRHTPPPFRFATPIRVSWTPPPAVSRQRKQRGRRANYVTLARLTARLVARLERPENLHLNH